MRATRVLAIGLDPAAADLSMYPELTPELVRFFIDQQIERVRTLGYDVDSCLIASVDDDAQPEIERALKSKAYDCVVLGAGLREPPELLELFEKVLNLVHEHAPRARIAFNTSPEDTVDAVLRWTAPTA